MYITKHAEKRLKQRCGFNKKSMERMVSKALNEGVSHKETKGELKKWVSGVYLKEKKTNNIRLYGDKAYLFHSDMLITVFQIPPYLTKNIKKRIISRKERESNGEKQYHFGNQ